jgi:phage terminase large subunit-like protein
MSESLIEAAIREHGPVKVFAHLSDAQKARIQYEWRLWARPEQLLPDDKPTIFLMAGRRFGKTRCAAEWVRRRVESGVAHNLILVAPTHNDMLTDMLNGPSGLITISPPWDKPEFSTVDNTLRWKNGARAICLSAERPERTRGKEIDTVWCDEIAAWNYPEIWDLLQFCGGHRPMRFVVTSTPRPTPLVRRLAKESDLVIRGSTYDNKANLDVDFLERMRLQYDGTKLGRQELYAEVLDDVEGALWTHSMIDALRVRAAPKFKRIVVAVDPSGSAKKTADEAGIVVAGLGIDGHGYVLEDISGKYSPKDMALTACAAYHKYGADRLVAEDNFGGQIVADLISLTDRRVAYKAVHASRGKIVRAEPVAALYEQSRIHHVGGFPKLEDELTSYSPMSATYSPGRMDALVWAFTELMLNNVAPIQRGVYRVTGSF